MRVFRPMQRRALRCYLPSAAQGRAARSGVAAVSTWRQVCGAGQRWARFGPKSSRQAILPYIRFSATIISAAPPLPAAGAEHRPRQRALEHSAHYAAQTARTAARGSPQNAAHNFHGRYVRGTAFCPYSLKQANNKRLFSSRARSTLGFPNDTSFRLPIPPNSKCCRYSRCRSVTGDS